jgi:hypothetical protein
MQLTTAGSLNRNRQFKAIVIGLVILGVIWELASWIVAGSDRTLIMFGLSLVVIALVVHILNDWRSGVLIFLVWLLFEDLVRKYLGNSMTVYFGKDVLVGIAYLSFYFAKRRRQVETVKIPFFVPLLVFVAFAVIQVFNPFSPNILYGVLGLKLYFYYAPLMYLGYAMLTRPKDLEQFLVINIGAGIVIAGLGIAQSILGVGFLNPADSAPELYELSHLTRYSPITHEAAFATSSVFVSAGRFSYYLILLWILVFGALGYLLLSRRSGAKYGFLGIGVVTVAVMITGTRTPFVFVIASALIMTAAFLWGAPWRWGQGQRMLKALRRAFLFGGIALILMVEVFPTIIGGNWAFFSETLSFSGEGSQLSNRGWEYPILNLKQSFEDGRWAFGHGTGLNSLGAQYVSRFLDEPLPSVNVESGYGALIVEFGILGPVFWFFWVSTLLWGSWRIVRQLRQTVYFPIGFAIWWYAVVMLVLLMYFGMQTYQNFVNNAYLFLLIGLLFRLPKLARMPQPVPIPRDVRNLARWQPAAWERQSIRM